MLLLGFIAIAVVLVYKATRDDGAAPVPTAPTAEALHLPAGAEIVSAVAAGNAISVTYRVGTAVQMRVFDANGKLLRQMDIVTE